MKTVMAIGSGLAGTVAAFSFGLGAALYFLHADPVEVSHPFKARGEVHAAELLPAGPTLTRFEASAAAVSMAPRDVREELALAVGPNEIGNAIDREQTSSISRSVVSAEPETELSAHVTWCSQRYRSYRADSNTYTAYSGSVRPCVSPFGSATAAQIEYKPAVSGHQVAHADTAHAQACSERYRSYRASDNTYQPYGGGPRRQCR